MSALPDGTYDPAREPFADPPPIADGIDPRVLGQGLAVPPHVDPETGEIIRDRRDTGVGSDISRQPWPPPSNGPLPPREVLAELDLNIFTAQDEIDAWAHEHDRATNKLAAVRRLLHGDPDDPDAEGVDEEFARKRAHHRREARRSPTERGRRTAEDINEEVNEALIADGVWRRRERLHNEADEALGRLFRAKDNIARLDSYVRSLPRVDNRP